MKNYKADFPIFATYPELIYADSGATAQKPQVVIDAVANFYTHTNANIHRGMYDLSQAATDQFEAVRGQVADFIGASSPGEIVFTSGATDSLNLAAHGWARQHLQRGDIIVLSDMEHHANLVPWQMLRDEIGVELFFLPLGDDYRLDYKSIQGLDMSRVKLLALTHASNVLGTINPITDIAAFFKTQGANTKLLVDASQSIPHIAIDVQALGADFVAFSSHKMCGPSGVGVLYGRQELLEVMTPMKTGGGMIHSVTKEKATWAGVPERFEAGTPNLEGVIGLGAAITYLRTIGMDVISRYEEELTTYALEQCKARGVQLIGPSTAHDRLGVFSFEVPGVHAHDVAELLNRAHVAIRAGHHCAQPLMQVLGLPGTARASFYIYNTKADIDAWLDATMDVARIMKVAK